MTTRQAADELANLHRGANYKHVNNLSLRQALELLKPEGVTNNSNVALPEPLTTALSATRRRVCATYCPTCAGWVEVRLQPVRLHCTGCGLEARP
jgi:hypothetical protein